MEKIMSTSMKSLRFVVVYLGAKTKTSQKGTDYTIAKFFTVDDDTLEFYVMPEKVEALKDLKQFMPCEIFLDITSSKGDVKIQLQQVLNIA